MNQIIRKNDKDIKRSLHREIYAWQAVAAGILVLATTVITVMMARINTVEHTRQIEAAQYQEALASAEHTRDLAVRELGALATSTAQEKLSRQKQEEAYEAISAYQYIGVCTITAYCPCEECCGRWADGLTATGIPAVPGIVAVDQDVIPLGSTVIMDGQRYLAADTGVTGQWIDICVASHQEAENFGVQMASIWVISQESENIP